MFGLNENSSSAEVGKEDSVNPEFTSSTSVPQIFEGTPLGDYLSDAGMSDWGIDDVTSSRQSMNLQEDNDDDDTNSNCKRSPKVHFNDLDFYQGDNDYESLIDNKQEEKMRRRIISGFSVPFPLTLSAGGMSTPELRKQRFLSLIKTALKPQLNELENAKFLERFRYVLISSKLLESISINTTAGHIDPFDRLSSRKHNILFGDDGPWNTLKMHKKYWSGGGGCIIVVVTLLSWQLKEGKILRQNRANDEPNSSSYYKATCGLVIILCVFLFLFAHSRRRSLRMLRARSIAYASYFVENNRSYDLAIFKCLSLIQEVDLLSLGYRPDLTESLGSGFKIPGSRIANHNAVKHMRTAKSLRSAVSSSLYLAITSYLNAIKDCISCCSELDIQRYFDIYELASPQQEFGFVMNDDFVGFSDSKEWELSRDDYYGSNGAGVSIKFLRREFGRFHFLRRAFICCLISATSTGDCTRQELHKWGTIVDHIESCSGLMMRLATTISRDSLLPEINEDKQQEVSLDPIAQSKISRLNHLTASLQHIHARMHLLSEEENTFDHNYELLGNDIRELLSTWQSRRSSNPSSCFKPGHMQNASTSTAATLVDINSHMLDEPIICNNLKSLDSDDSNSIASSQENIIRPRYGSIRDPVSTRSTSASSMTILEGIVEIEHGKSRPSSPLSREARINFMKQQREIEAQKKAVMAQRHNFVLELGSVLDQRRNFYDE